MVVMMCRTKNIQSCQGAYIHTYHIYLCIYIVCKYVGGYAAANMQRILYSQVNSCMYVCAAYAGWQCLLEWVHMLENTQQFVLASIATAKIRKCTVRVQVLNRGNHVENEWKSLWLWLWLCLLSVKKCGIKLYSGIQGAASGKCLNKKYTFIEML